MATFIADSAVTLYHNNLSKLATTTTGIDVTGSVTCDDDIVIGGETPTLTLTDASSGNYATISPNNFDTYLNNKGRFFIQNQGSTKVTVSTAGNVIVSTGNLVIGTSGKGIDFSANGNAGGMTSEVLDDYEEGTWTAGFTGATVSAGNTVGYYTKIGNRVFFQYYSSTSTISSASGSFRMTGLPFTSSGATDAYGLFLYQHGNAVDGNSRGGLVSKNGTILIFLDDGNTTQSTAINGSPKYIMVSGHYYV
jgi:hypothetical protein